MKTQRTFKNLKALALSLACLGLLACKARNSESVPEGALKNIPVDSPAVPSGEMGSSSGGGGFADETAAAVLKASIDELTHDIRRASSDIFGDLPAGWSQEKIAKIFENTRINFGVSRQRTGRNLNFDYGYAEDGTPYIEALQAFSNGLTGVPFDVMNTVRRRELIDGTKLRLAHELSHLLGYGITEETDIDARAMGYRLLKALDSDTISCRMTEDYPEFFPSLVYEMHRSSWPEKEEFISTHYNHKNHEPWAPDSTVFAFQIAINFPSGLGRVAMESIHPVISRIKMNTKVILPSGIDPAQLFSDIERVEPWLQRFLRSPGFYSGLVFAFEPQGFRADETFLDGYLLRNDDSTVEVGYGVQYWGWRLKYDPVTSTATYYEFIESDSPRELPKELTLDMNCSRVIMEFIPTEEDDEKTWNEIMAKYRENPKELQERIPLELGWRD